MCSTVFHSKIFVFILGAHLACIFSPYIILVHFAWHFQLCCYAYAQMTMTKSYLEAFVCIFFCLRRTVVGYLRETLFSFIGCFSFLVSVFLCAPTCVRMCVRGMIIVWLQTLHTWYASFSRLYLFGIVGVGIMYSLDWNEKKIVCECERWRFYVLLQQYRDNISQIGQTHKYHPEGE